MKPTITVVYIVFNQSNLLKNSLKTLSKSIDQILIADLSSTEDIRGIAKSFGAKYQKLPYAEVVESVRNKVFDSVKTDYLLYLDADESVSKELISILSKEAESGVDYVAIPRQNYIFGKWVQASRWWPDHQVRFFKRGQVKWPTTLHNQPEVLGRGVQLSPNPALSIIHNNYKTIDEWLEKNRRYAQVEASTLIKNGDSYTLSIAMHRSISELVSRFFAGRGWSDGLHGLMLAILQSFYYFLVYSYYWEGKRFAELESKQEVRSFPRTWFTHGLSEIMHWDTRDQNIYKLIKTKLIRKIIV